MFYAPRKSRGDTCGVQFYGNAPGPSSEPSKPISQSVSRSSSVTLSEPRSGFSRKVMALYLALLFRRVCFIRDLLVLEMIFISLIVPLKVVSTPVPTKSGSG